LEEVPLEKPAEVVTPLPLKEDDSSAINPLISRKSNPYAESPTKE
jgi:hypothetical protein